MTTEETFYPDPQPPHQHEYAPIITPDTKAEEVIVLFCWCGDVIKVAPRLCS